NAESKDKDMESGGQNERVNKQENENKQADRVRTDMHGQGIGNDCQQDEQNTQIDKIRASNQNPQESREGLGEDQIETAGDDQRAETIDFPEEHLGGSIYQIENQIKQQQLGNRVIPHRNQAAAQKVEKNDKQAEAENLGEEKHDEDDGGGVEINNFENFHINGRWRNNF
ncbi:MAG: hypothetical protein UX86_C0001G0046, partial [Candidatus Amesbacteria bacterium GW2011_GWC1_47_15]